MDNERRLTKKEKKELRKLEWQQKADREKRNALFKKVGTTIGVVLVVVISVVGLVKLAGSSGLSSSSGINVSPVSKKDITQGNPKSKVTLIEYSDFQCPACAAYHPVVTRLLTEYQGKIFFIFRMFPLTNAHPNAKISAQAAYAAKNQGKFFEMSDLLFEKQTEWAELSDPTTAFTDYAKLLKLDVNKFKAGMNSDEAKNYVNDSERQGLTEGIISTPSFFVNGEQIATPATYDEFKKIIQDEINKK